MMVSHPSAHNEGFPPSVSIHVATTKAVHEGNPQMRYLHGSTTCSPCVCVARDFVRFGIANARPYLDHDCAELRSALRTAADRRGIACACARRVICNLL